MSNNAVPFNIIYDIPLNKKDLFHRSSPNFSRAQTSKDDLMRLYKETKDELCVCMTCAIENPTKKIEAKAQLHHLYRETKIDTVYHMITRNKHPGACLDELFKCVPLCDAHHREFHKLEDRGHIEQLEEKFDFQSSEYADKIEIFQEGIVDKLTPEMVRDIRYFYSYIKRNGFNDPFLLKR